VSFHFRGEWLDDTAALDASVSYSVCALSDVAVAVIPNEAFQAVIAKHPQIALGLWREAVIEGALLRQANLNLGLRGKPAALAHLFCELHMRARFAGLCENGTCEIPITQAELASALGMALVTLNRTLQLVRETKAVEFKNGRLTVMNFKKLADYAGFEPRYLHLPAK
jgi:CRP-like cAMP-binding protein